MRARNGDVSFWLASIGGAPKKRASLPGPTECDVCIVGAGYTGLWTAWYLKKLRPGLRIVVVEQAHAGFGASGRNGGWLSGLLPGNRELMAKGVGGKEGVLSLQRHLTQTVDLVIKVCEDEGIDADINKSGSLSLARSSVQQRRLRSEIREARQWGLGEADLWELNRAELESQVRADRAISGSFTPHCARVQPAKLVKGLAEAAELSGVEIYEATPALSIGPHLVNTIFGAVEAAHVVRATEGFTARLPGLDRTLLPMNSSMIATEPLSESQWDEIGWAGAETLKDCSNAYVYAQRTVDGRIAIGGRGKPYRYGSRTDWRGVTDESTIEALSESLASLFPACRGVPVAHAWSGVLGVARDWCPSVGLDKKTGIAWAGGYVGDGVATSNLAGRTVADLIAGEDTDLVRLPWVGHESRMWEPEPLRWLGVRSVYALYRAADKLEMRNGRKRVSKLGRLADRIVSR